MLIAIASDHNALGLKASIVAALETADYHFIDLGPWGSGAVDYTDYASQLGRIVAAGDCDMGVLACGTGVGMSIVANKVPGVRAALVHNDISALKSREHNDSNVICLGAWIRPDAENIGAAKIFLEGEFGAGRHVRRVEKIDRFPNNIVFANGCFDILHQGHVEMLRWSKGLGSWLVVGLNSDASVRAIKGSGRPINPEAQRKKVLESLRFVDEVIISDTPTALIEEVHPSIVVKGEEWSAAEVRMRDAIPAWCEVKVFPLVQGYSTTTIVERIRA